MGSLNGYNLTLAPPQAPARVSVSVRVPVGPHRR
jgi:hypothetical protein